MNPFAELAETGERRKAEVTLKGVPYTFEGSSFGEDYFDTLFPDAAKVTRDTVHYAKLNGRKKPYPVSIWGDVEAMFRTFQPQGGQIAPDRESIYRLYDGDPSAFALLRGSALVAIGLLDNARLNSGEQAWSSAFLLAKIAERALREGKDLGEVKEKVAELRRLIATALKDFVSPEDAAKIESDHPDDVDETMEGLEGNSGAGPTSPPG